MAQGKLGDIQKLAQDRGIPIKEETPKVQQGWEGKAKGMLQILWEWGFIDSNNVPQYSMQGKKDAFGNVQKETSLKYLMSNCQDFEEEETLLQSMDRSMGVIVDHMLKCHCKLAGEGIEYSWCCSRNQYRWTPIAEKRGKEGFIKTVRKCLSQDVLMTECILKFSKQAREYICAYHKHWEES